MYGRAPLIPSKMTADDISPRRDDDDITNVQRKARKIPADRAPCRYYDVYTPYADKSS